MTIKINFEGVNDDEINEGGGTPPGEYLCRVEDASEGTTNSGSVRLNFGLRIIDGDHKGKMAGFDSLYFHSDTVVKRAKFILRRMGLMVDSKDFSIDAEELNGRVVLVKTQAAPKCPDCKWDAKPSSKDEQGRTIYKCQSDRECGWQGLEVDVLPYTAPRWNGYEMAEGTVAENAAKNSAKPKVDVDSKDVPF